MNFQYEDVAARTLSVQTCKELAHQVKKDIDAFCIKELTGEHREHLGASVIGHECERFIWYAFRWVKFQIFDGRMLRLFERGHLEEQRILRWLRGAGCQVWDVDPNTGKQFKIYGVGGHYGGSADSVGILKYFPDLPMLLEFKTHNYKSFSNLINKGLILSKYRHYSQMCSYGKEYGFRYGMYIGVGKNDDDLHIEIVPLDWNRAHDLVTKAQDVILAKIPPPRISDQPSYFECKYCSMQGICHYGEPVEKNCRSCKHATPIENAEWRCEYHKSVIPSEWIAKGCDNHVSVNS